MKDRLIQYCNQIQSTFYDFLNHEIIAKDPFTLTDEEIWIGIKERSNKRPFNNCDFINRMNRYCTLVTVVGHHLKPTNYNTTDYGILKFSFNESSVVEILYSTLIYPHKFCDEGMISNSFVGGGKEFYSTLDILSDGKRISNRILPKSIFENPKNIGVRVFFECSLEGSNIFNSIKQLPSFVDIDGTESYFINEVKVSLLKTKVVLLSLVDKFPTHLMPEPAQELKKNQDILKATFLESYNRNISDYIQQELSNARQQLRNCGISLNMPF